MTKDNVIAAVSACVRNHPLDNRDVRQSDHKFEGYLDDVMGKQGAVFAEDVEENDVLAKDATTSVAVHDQNSDDYGQESDMKGDSEQEAFESQGSLTSGDDPVPEATLIKRKSFIPPTGVQSSINRYSGAYMSSGHETYPGRPRKTSPIQPGRSKKSSKLTSSSPPKPPSLNPTTRPTKIDTGSPRRHTTKKAEGKVTSKFSHGSINKAPQDPHLPFPSHVDADDPMTHPPDLREIWSDPSYEMWAHELEFLSDLINELGRTLSSNVLVVPWFTVNGAFQEQNKIFETMDIIKFPGLRKQLYSKTMEQKRVCMRTFQYKLCIDFPSDHVRRVN